MNEQELEREQRENLHKWGKARRLIDEDKIETEMQSEDRYAFKVEGDSNTYTVGVDIDSGKSFCPCPFKGDNCAHQLAAHLKLAGIGVENDTYR